MAEQKNRWPLFRRVERRARRTQNMIEQLDVDALKLVRQQEGETYKDVVRRCLECCSGDTCARWLDLESSDKPLPEFCPNLKVFLRCRTKTRASASTNKD